MTTRSEDLSDDEFLLPLSGPGLPHGASLRKRGVKFVAAGTLTNNDSAAPKSGADVANTYLSLVLGLSIQHGCETPVNPRPQAVSALEGNAGAPREDKAMHLCPTSKLPRAVEPGVEEERSLVQQISQAHIRPPHALDRRRFGLRQLEAQGWDAEGRMGLGVRGEGIRAPVIVRERRGRGGLGLEEREVKEKEKGDEKGGGLKRAEREGKGKGRVEKGGGLSRREMRRAKEEEARMRVKLHDMFYGDDRLARYLGENAY